MNCVSWGDAARFANWLHNDQPTGAQGLATTEDGAYFLNGVTSNAALRDITRDPDATWVIPTADEWYEVAYHKNDAGTGNYFDYPTSSDSVPSNALDGSGNNATFYGGGYTIGSPYYRTEFGAHVNSESPYDTFDQGGNAFEWNEAVILSYRGTRGGTFHYGDNSMRAANRYYGYPTIESFSTGFRVATTCFKPDPDNDGISDPCDNCPLVPNFNQADDDVDGVGDLCDVCPNTLAPMGVDAAGRSLGDLDFDCDVDLNDFNIFSGNFTG